MSTQETVKLTVELIVSNGVGEGELPNDMRFAAKLHDKLGLMQFSDQSVALLGVTITGRTGDL